MELLHVLDGYGYIFRAFYGMRGGDRPVQLTTASGMPTAALNTYANMLIRLYLTEKPERIAVVFDAPGESFRKQLYPEYKAKRKETPPELARQMPLFRPLTEAFCWPVLAVPGYEADDVIAAVVRRARERGFAVKVYTGDKDLMQLVGEGVELHDAMRNRSYDADAVQAKLGVRPDQVRDYLALVGDSSDNVPGMPGVGAKSAAGLLDKYGSIEGILAHVEELPTRQRNLFKNADKLAVMELSRELVTLHDEVDFGAALEDLVPRAWEPEAMIELFHELEFYSHLERLRRDMPEAERDRIEAILTDVQRRGKAGEAPAAAPEIPEPRTITGDDELAALVAEARAAGAIALWVETDGRRADRAALVGIGVGIADRAPAYIPISHRYLGAPAQLRADAMPAFAALLADPDVAVTCHDAKETARVLARAGLPVAGICMDTMLASYLLDVGRAVAIERVLQSAAAIKVPTRKQLLGTGKKRVAFEELMVEEGAAYAGKVAGALVHGGRVLASRLETAGLAGLLADLELPLAVLLARIEEVGIALDVGHLSELAGTLSGRIATLEHAVRELAGDDINLGSPKQLSSLLFERLGLRAETMRKTKTGYSTDHDVLESLRDAHPVVAPIIEHRELLKLKNTYIDALPPLVNPSTGRVHTSFQQAVAATGRLSSADPNLQNIPVRTELGREIRRAFVAAEGKQLVSIDYSQIELRILAHLSEDPVLLRAFQNDVDVHSQTAAEVFEVPLAEVTADQRRVAKAVNYGLVYGQSGFGLAQALGIPRGDARRYIAKYFDRFAGVRKYMDDVVAQAARTGYAVTLLGRRRPIPELASSNAQRRKAAERIAQNTPVQGTAADIMKLAMLAVSAALDATDTGAQILLTVHDELVFEVAPERADELVQIVRPAMEGAYELAVPIVTSVGIARSWADAHE